MNGESRVRRSMNSHHRSSVCDEAASEATVPPYEHEEEHPEGHDRAERIFRSLHSTDCTT